MNNSRRSGITVLADMLKLINQNGGKARHTDIYRNSNLSYSRLKKYLNYLIEKGLIIKMREENYFCYKIIQKGYDFIEQFRKVEEFLKNFGMDKFA